MQVRCLVGWLVLFFVFFFFVRWKSFNHFFFMKYSIEQYPKNKDTDAKMLSAEMKLVRAKHKHYTYGKTFKCKCCGKTLRIKEFYVKDKHTGRRSTKCRDCVMRQSGIVEIGRVRFAKDIFKKHFRRCSVCKNIKPLTEYAHDKNRYGGYANNCKECNSAAVAELQQRGKKTISDWYVREYGKRSGLSKFDKPTINKLRKEIIENRKPKYFIDGKEFVTIAEFARYIESEYGLPITMTEKRISEGKTLEECKLTENQMRSMAYTKGKIKVTDTVTGKTFEFVNTNDAGLLKMFSMTAITQGIKTGNKTRITKLSKYKNPCTIERI